jgi:copper chaperone CopZ
MVLGLLAFGCAANDRSPSGPNPIERRGQAVATEALSGPSATLVVNGLSCPLCATNIDRQLLRVPGVTSATVDLGRGEVRLGLDGSGQTSRHALDAAVDSSGFTLVEIRQP